MVGKQLKGDKNSIKWGLIIGIFLVFFAGPVLAEEVSFGQTEFSGVLSGDLIGQQGSHFQYFLNDKTHPIIGKATSVKFWLKSGASASTFYSALVWDVRDIGTDELVGGGVWSDFCKLGGISYIPSWFDLEVQADCPDIDARNVFSEPEEGTYIIYFLYPNIWPYVADIQMRGADDAGAYPYGFCSGANCGDVKDLYFEITGVFSFYPGMPPPPARIFGISPESGSTITNLEDEFIVGWEELPEGTNFITLNFINEATGITEGSGAFFIEETSGEKSFHFSNFNFEKNGLFRLFAGGGIKLGLIFFPVWIEVSPPYYINLNIEGLPGYFQMPNFLEWYQENAMFNEPTAIFSAVAGFISPLYDKIGEFGNRVSVFLNTDDAYNYGYNLGLIFPTFRHYINEIDVLFGGFPIITIFLVILILFLAIFIFRLILKFIPGLG